MNKLFSPDIFGADPANIVWKVVRGDTATLKVEFLQQDEKTFYDISSWSFESSVYDPRGNTIDVLDVEKNSGFVVISARPFITEGWGEGFSKIVANLSFDLQATFNGTVWTPIIGSIHVLGDVSGRSV